MSTVKKAAIEFGIVFLAIGVLGTIPAAQGRVLSGFFHIDSLHKNAQLLTGVVGIVAGLIGTQASRLYFQVLGIAYAIVAILGFAFGQANRLGIMANNLADAWLHVAIASVALYFGFAWAEKRHPAASLTTHS